MHSALWLSMNPIPPMLAARLKTWQAPAAARSQLSRRFKSRVRFSTSGNDWYHSFRGLISTARILVNPRRRKSATNAPPMKPPAPVTNTHVIGFDLLGPGSW